MATFEQGQIGAGQITEKEMAKLWPKVVDSYNQALVDINESIAKLYSRMPSFTDKEKQDAAMMTWAQQRDRLTKLKKDITATLTKSQAKAGRIIGESSEIGITNTYYREQYTLQFFSDGQLPFSNISEDVVASSVYGSEEAWKRIKEDIYGSKGQYFPQGGTLSDLLRRDRNETLRQIQQAITSGLIRGVGADELGRDIAQIIGKDTPQGTTGLKAKSARIARTEGIRNLNAGYSASLNTAVSEGVEMQKRWVATLDNRTRHTHQSADGQEVDVDENFTVNGSTGPFPGQMSTVGENANCRCSTIAVIPGLEPTARSVRDEDGKTQIFSYKNFPEWAADNGLKTSPSGKLIQA